MSVINQMLRDLDARQAAPASSAMLAGVQPVERPVPVAPLPASGRRPRWLLGGSLILLALAGAWWTGRHSGGAAPASAASASVGPAPAGVAPQPSARASSVPEAQAQVAPTVSATQQARSPTMAAASVTAPPALQRQPAAVAVPESVRPAIAPMPSPAPVTIQARVETPSPAIVKTPADRPAVSDSRAVPRSLVAAEEARPASPREAAAQPGEDAVDVLTQARQALAAQQPRGAQELLRPLAGTGRLGAEGWLLLANAAQRLGEHEEALRAYDGALQRRPGEAGWQAGKAISLQALGRREEAAALAAQARASGRLDSRVDAYLEQLGL